MKTHEAAHSTEPARTLSLAEVNGLGRRLEAKAVAELVQRVGGAAPAHEGVAPVRGGVELQSVVRRASDIGGLGHLACLEDAHLGEEGVPGSLQAEVR